MSACARACVYVCARVCVFGDRTPHRASLADTKQEGRVCVYVSACICACVCVCVRARARTTCLTEVMSTEIGPSLLLWKQTFIQSKAKREAGRQTDRQILTPLSLKQTLMQNKASERARARERESMCVNERYEYVCK